MPKRVEPLHPEVRRVLDGLNHPRWDIKYHTLKELKSPSPLLNGHPALRNAILEILTGNESALVRESAIEALQSYPGGQTTPTLVKFLTSTTPNERVHAQNSLVMHGTRSIPALLEGAKSADTILRCGSIDTLGRIRSPRSVRAVRAALDDPEWQVREIAIVAMKKLGPKSAADAIAEKLKDPEPRVLLTAVDALSEMKSPKAFPHVLRGLRMKNNDMTQRMALGNAIKLAEALQGHPDAVRFAQTLHRYLKSQNAAKRELAAKALGTIGHTQSILPLIRWQKTDPRHAYLANEALSSISRKIRQEPRPPTLDTPLEFALFHIDPAVHPKAFTRLLKDARSKKFRENGSAWWQFHAQSLTSQQQALKTGR